VQGVFYGTLQVMSLKIELFQNIPRIFQEYGLVWFCKPYITSKKIIVISFEE